MGTCECDDMVDIEPDISVLCHDTSYTSIDCLDTKREIAWDGTPTTTSHRQQFRVQQYIRLQAGSRRSV